ncbi:hypothetical protein DEFR109230_03550 [Deinococcus frigens]|uniref:hypothetical protein n=1 Tax=Deinococcus frigens TaxID=249403 RepID=UPI0012EC23DF|nr:hypothetical protein [Deinococcus frigens]
MTQPCPIRLTPAARERMEALNEMRLDARSRSTSARLLVLNIPKTPPHLNDGPMPWPLALQLP